MLTVYSNTHHLRNATELVGGQIVPSYERPERAEFILEQVKCVKLGNIIKPAKFDLKPTLAIHDSAYITFLQTCWDEWLAQGNKGDLFPFIWPSRTMPSKRIPKHLDGKIGYYCLSSDTSINAGTWAAAKLSADVALTATQQLTTGNNSAFALCRPPGHHATNDAYGGYCFLNNVAISAQWLLDNGASRVSILDVDFHHGNGTQSIFYDRDDVQFLSLHGQPEQCFPHFSGYADERGEGAGLGYNFNYPLAPSTDYKTWQQALDQALEEIVNYSPDVLLVSLGVDTYENDPISSFKLQSDDFKTYGSKISSLSLPTVFILEGGYAVEEIGLNTVNVLSSFEKSHSCKGF